MPAGREAHGVVQPVPLPRGFWPLTSVPMKLPMMVLPPSMRFEREADPSEAVDDKRADGATASTRWWNGINGEAGGVGAGVHPGKLDNRRAGEVGMRRAVDDHLVNQAGQF